MYKDTKEIITDDDIREAKREYYRQWKASNKDKVAANNKRYWERKALERKMKTKHEGEN